MAEKMRAMVIHGPDAYSVDWVDIPTPKRDEALVAIKAVAICGSDPRIIGGGARANGWPPAYPFIAGHEYAGEVVAIGEGVSRVAVGDRVAGEAHCGCGTCPMCMRGMYTLCMNYGNARAGHRHYGHAVPGAYAQYQVFGERALTKLPESISFDEGALVDTAGTGYHALRLCGVAPGGYTAMIGPGPIGLLAMAQAKALGSRTIMIGRGGRLRFAKARMGADHIVDIEAEDPVAAVLRITGGEGADQVIEAAGNPDVFLQSVQMAKKGGHVALISIPTEDAQPIAVKSLVMRQITLHGVRANPNCSAPVIAMMASGALDAGKIITHTFPLEEIREAMDTFRHRKDGAVKVIVRP